ncbi:MAG TPA: type VI secretion system-associated protein TagF [Albitalea sp.]|uniref:type VI secretion system-associated protein TagF n=1 Tax=Piscinibacter sp. TaxID=1903157 RepID=UPI002ED0C792
MSEAALTDATALPGWFGKVPALGDFASRRLPDAFVQRWDRWLQRGLSRVRSELGEAWLDAYLVAPILRFWLGPGVLGASGWAGLLMPSVDRVGRHFPLTIAQPLDPLAAALAAREWFHALDGAARKVLDVDFTVEDLERELAAIAPPDECAGEADERLAAQLHAGFERDAFSVWWRDEAGPCSTFQCFPTLPPAPAFVSLIAEMP